MDQPQTCVLQPSARIDLRLTLAPLWLLGPSFRRRPDGYWRATRTPDGPGVQRLRPVEGSIVVDAWGPGATWLIANAGSLVGADEDHSGLSQVTLPPQEPGQLCATPEAHRAVLDLHRRHLAMRTPRTNAVFEALVPAILTQKVTGKEAGESFRALFRHFGEKAPTPPGGPRLQLPFSPARVKDAPSYVFHACNVERKRADTIRLAASYAHRLEEATGFDRAAAYQRLQSLPGVGIWTANEVAAVAWGDPDAVSVGDFHLKNSVAWNLAGRPRGSDEEMVQLLEPYRPFRGRVIRLLSLGGSAPPKYGPRLTIQTRW